MTWLATLTSLILIVPAALHLLWAIGYWLPIRDEAYLTRAVVGARGMTKMPGAIPCAVVAMALLFAAMLPHNPAFPMQDQLLTAAAALFLLRGGLTYTPLWRKHFCEEPFATLDQRFYGPLIIVVGMAFLILRTQGA